jgi:hypothetical protein
MKIIQFEFFQSEMKTISFFYWQSQLPKNKKEGQKGIFFCLVLGGVVRVLRRRREHTETHKKRKRETERDKSCTEPSDSRL